MSASPVCRGPADDLASCSQYVSKTLPIYLTQNSLLVELLVDQYSHAFRHFSIARHQALRGVL